MKKLDRQTRVLITGGCGFIGRHLIAHLLSKTDWDIVSLDSLTYATDTTLTPLDGVRHYYHDLRSPVPEVLKEKIGDVDYFFNVASESHVDRSIDSPVPFVMNNVALVLHALEYARELKGLKRFFQISTDEVYGPAAMGVFHKEWNTHLPSNPYSASKSAQESIAIAYNKTYGLPVTITNTMNNFGPGQHKEKFIPKCISMLKAGKAVPIHAEYVNGEWRSGSRCWLHATNHADGLLFLANVQEALPSLSKFHIAGDESSNLEVLIFIADMLGVDPLYEMVDWHSSRKGHDPRYALDGSLIKECGWTPPISFYDGLKATVESYLCA